MSKAATAVAEQEQVVDPWPVPDPRNFVKVAVPLGGALRLVTLHLDGGQRDAWIIDVKVTINDFGHSDTKVVRTYRGQAGEHGSNFAGAYTYNEIVLGRLSGCRVILPRDFSEGGFLVAAGSVVEWAQAVQLGAVPSW